MSCRLRLLFSLRGDLPARGCVGRRRPRGVEGENLATRAIEALREAVPGRVPPLRVRIEKRVPVAAGLGGGSADAAAVLRVANRLGGGALDADRLRSLAAEIGSDVPSQVEPGHALVCGVG